ncbi:alpha/beta hydrolase [Vibrio salinus]|uniref:alpha/beta hydrolase n=1 Tax=Vibrio salinus TaxID=2899784 RepID=UPI001E4EE4DE|nr:alpha/beta hydrolase [Vibrio salinus]MCE0492900.1 alpha/beta hydrolase [Vibrio salinus]
MTIRYLEQGIRELVDGFISAGCPSVREQTIAERRQGYLDSVYLAGEKEAVFQIQEITIDGITLRIYKPSDKKGLPVAVYFHGGCFVSGGFDTHDSQFRALVNKSGCILIAVKYRLAPENIYPAAHDDAYLSTLLIHKHCQEWGGDPENIILVGDSAGGHLCLVTSLRLKERSGWLPAKQILIYPMLDATASGQSYRDNGRDYIITKDTLMTGYEMYFQDTEKTHPEASPLFRTDLAGLPETHILTAEFDPLVDEGEQLYRRLISAGVNVQCRRYLGVIHGFFQLAGVSQAAKESITHVAEILKFR